ncbi:MAG: hypothetical protein H6968_11110 [Chromatiaceae bacterium]|nr:hypothetical protein [Chromatiaceae bacterium]
MKLHLLAIGLLPEVLVACSGEIRFTDGQNTSAPETARKTGCRNPILCNKQYCLSDKQDSER